MLAAMPRKKMKLLIIGLIKFYQSNRPKRLNNICIYEPSCSEYAIQAIDKYGWWTGTLKGINRIGRCNSNYSGGLDLP